MPRWALVSRQVTASTVPRLRVNARHSPLQCQRYTTTKSHEDRLVRKPSSADEQLLRLKEGDAGLIRDPTSSSADYDALNFILAGYEAQPKRRVGVRQRIPRAKTEPHVSRHNENRAIEAPKTASTPSSDKRTAETRRRERNLRNTSQKPTQATTHLRPILSPRKAGKKALRLVYRRIRANTVHVEGLPHKYASVNVRRELSSPFALSFWRTRFTKLARKYDVHVRHEYEGSDSAPHLDYRAALWVDMVKSDITAGREQTSIKRIADDASQPSEKIWMTMALYLLHHDVEMVPGFLRWSHGLAFSPAECVTDCLQYLAQYHTLETSDSEKIQDLARLFGVLGQRKPKDPLAFHSSFVRLLLPHCTHEQVSEMYRVIKAHQVKVHPNSLLHLTAFFAKNEHFDQALDVLLAAHAAGADLRSVPFRSACSTLLRRAMRQPGGLRVCLRLIDNLVSIGLQLNNQLCNIVMLNAVEAGDLDTAFSIYTSLVDHGLKADAHTYAIMLKGCKMRIDDAETLNDIVRSAIRDINVLQNTVVASEILHCLALHHARQTPEQAFATISEAFLELFDPGPLLELGVPFPSTRPSDAEAKLLVPPPQAVTVMLNTFLHHASHITATRAAQEQMYDIYQRYRELALSNQEPFASLVATDYVSNAFLVAFNRTRRTLVHSAQVVRDMQKPPRTDSKETGEWTKLKQCQPTVITWTIFLNGFRQHGQLKLAAQVLNYMRSKGIEPDNVTWNSLVAGYANDQDFEGVFDTLRNMEASGAVWDHWTYGGLKRLRDQWRLNQEMEKVRRMKKLDFTGELRESLERRLADGKDDLAVHIPRE